MKDQQLSWIESPKEAATWSYGWLLEAKQGHHSGVKAIREAARKFKARFNTNGLWTPDINAIKVYDILRDAADDAQEAYKGAIEKATS